MSEASFPDELKSFILQYLDSVAKLEALLLMHQQPRQAWSPSLLAQRLYVPVAVAQPILASLRDAGLCALSGEAYVYQPASPGLAELVERLEQHYSRHLLTITEMIHYRSDTGAQLFSDAFRLKKQLEED